jgi:chromosome segregation ATPase
MTPRARSVQLRRQAAKPVKSLPCPATSREMQKTCGVIVRRIETLEGDLLSNNHDLKAMLDDHERRIAAIESKWEWLTETLGRLLQRISDIGERTTVLVQQNEELSKQIGGLACSRGRSRDE